MSYSTFLPFGRRADERFFWLGPHRDFWGLEINVRVSFLSRAASVE